MEPYVESERGVYPLPMTANPRLWGTDFKTFLFPFFAVYFEKQNRFCLYRIKVAGKYHILEPYRTERTDPYYLNPTGNPSNHPLEVYSVKSQFPFCIWFQEAWLCRKNGPRMSPVIPVMKLTNFINNCKYTKYFSTTVYESPAAIEWFRQYKTIDKSMVRLATDIALPIPHEPVLAAEPHPIPVFVSTLLIEDAIAKKQDCSITMEPITATTATVTSCYHVFDKDAIRQWLGTNKTCPVCKQKCTLSS
jgi:hypothetical protein